MTARRRLLAWIGVALLPPLVILLAGYIAYAEVALDIPPRLSAAARAAAVVPLRAALAGETPATPTQAELVALTLPGTGIVVVSVWLDGRRMLSVTGHGHTAADALADAAREIMRNPTTATLPAARRPAIRLAVDVVVARSPLITSSTILTQLGVVPGMDGVEVSIGDVEPALMPDELVRETLLSTTTPVKQIAEFTIGLDFAKVDGILRVRSGLAADDYAAAHRVYYRVRTDSFVEQPLADRGADAAPLPLTRGLPPGPSLSKEHLLRAAIWGGDYLIAHFTPNGRFLYEVNLVRGTATDPVRGNYSIPRHAGTSYYLAQLYGFTHDAKLRATLEQAIEHMLTLIKAGGCEGTTAAGKRFVCVVERGAKVTELGSTALAAVAIAQYHLATGDTRYDEDLRGMAEWILMMQKPSGLIAKVYDVAGNRIDMVAERDYFDGEAALALVRAGKVLHDDRYFTAAGRTLDALVARYDFFVGRFFFGEEHWTCIAAEAGWPELKNPRYADFCSAYGAFLRDQQFDPGEVPSQPDLTGAYSVTPFLVPHNTPTGSRSEAMISAYLLTKYHGRPDAALRRQVLSAMRYLLGQQIRPDSDWGVMARAALGGMPESTINPSVRIDYVQHTCSAMLRSIELLRDEPADSGYAR